MIFLLGLLSFYEIHDFSTLLSNNPTMQALKKKKKLFSPAVKESCRWIWGWATTESTPTASKKLNSSQHERYA